MKKHLGLVLFVLGLFTASLSNAQEQYPIPSFNVELTGDNTTFEETEGLVLISPMTIAEKNIRIKVDDNNPQQTSWVTVIIYSLDGQDELGPYTVVEGTPLEVPVDEREWGVMVVNYLDGAILSVWKE